MIDAFRRPSTLGDRPHDERLAAPDVAGRKHLRVGALIGQHVGFDVAALVKLDATGQKFEDVRLSIAGIGPVPYRLAEVEAFLRGAQVTAERLERAAEMPVALVASRTRQDYRREVVRGFMLRGLINAVRRAGGELKTNMRELEVNYA